MLSILIPNFNDNCQNLVYSLAQEIEKLDVEVELIVGDDASTDTEIQNSYYQLENLPYVRLIKNKTNLGREKTRVLLARAAQYNWLLFLDADVIPQKKNFIDLFIKQITKDENTDVIFGGIKYQEKPTNTQFLLRWKYGKENEAQSLKQRKNNTYKSLVTGAICIQKHVFLEYTLVLDHVYGLDMVLAYQLKKAKTAIKHINNAVFHLGLENNETFVHKTEDALKSIILLENKNIISNNFRPIQQAFLKLKKLKLISSCNLIYKTLAKLLVLNLKSNSPNLFCFNLYRMLYFCHLKQVNSLDNEN